MAKVLTPQGERIRVQRRWYPWPAFLDSPRLQHWGMPEEPALFLGQDGRGDVIVAALTALFLLTTLVISPLVFMVLFTAGLAFTLFGYFARPWVIETLHDGALVEVERMEGFGPTTQRIHVLSALYRSGGLKPPGALRADPIVTPTKTSTLPTATALPTNVAKPEATDKAESVFAPQSAFATDDPPPQLTRTPPVEPISNESPLRRAIRLMFEERRLIFLEGLRFAQRRRSAAQRAAPKRNTGKLLYPNDDEK